MQWNTADDVELRDVVVLPRSSTSKHRTNIQPQDFYNDYLPDEIVLQIFQFLNYRDLEAASEVCTQWNRIAQDPKLCSKFPQHKITHLYRNWKPLLHKRRNKRIRIWPFVTSFLAICLLYSVMLLSVVSNTTETTAVILAVAGAPPLMLIPTSSICKHSKLDKKQLYRLVMVAVIVPMFFLISYGVTFSVFFARWLEAESRLSVSINSSVEDVADSWFTERTEKNAFILSEYLHSRVVSEEIGFYNFLDSNENQQIQFVAPIVYDNATSSNSSLWAACVCIFSNDDIDRRITLDKMKKNCSDECFPKWHTNMVPFVRLVYDIGVYTEKNGILTNNSENVKEGLAGLRNAVSTLEEFQRDTEPVDNPFIFVVWENYSEYAQIWNEDLAQQHFIGWTCSPLILLPGGLLFIYCAFTIVKKDPRL